MTYQSPNHEQNKKKYREKHRDRLLKENRDRYRSDTKKYIYYMFKRAEKRAKSKNLPFELKVNDIIIPEHCPILGLKLSVSNIGKKGPSNSSPSLDRIIPEKGYVKDNIMVISMKANKIKSDASIADIEKVLFYLKSTIS